MNFLQCYKRYEIGSCSQLIYAQKSIFRKKERKNIGSQLGFPTGRDGATFRDKGTEVPSLSRDKGTKGQAQNLAIQLKLFSATID